MPDTKQKINLKYIALRHNYLLYEGLIFGFIIIVLGIIYLLLPVTYENNNQNVMPSSTIYIKFKRPASRSINYKIEPEIPGKWITHDTPLWINAVEFVPDTHLPPGEIYRLIIEDIKPVISISQNYKTMVFPVTTQSPPIIKSAFPADGEVNVKTDSKITLRLSEANRGLRKLRAESTTVLKNVYPTTTDDITFTWEYKDALDRDKEHTFTIIDDLQIDESNKILAKSTFKTVPGAVIATNLSPNGVIALVNSPIGITFNQEVNKISAEKAFFINPSVRGKFSWSRNVLIFEPSEQSYGTKYTYGIIPGVEAIYGLVGATKFQAAYTTDYRTVKLSVPSYKQTYRLSCEESALRMALAYRGINVSDWDVLQKVGYNPRPRDTLNNSWDDPDLMYVGDVDGEMGVTGWGVYSGPLAQAAKSYGREADAILGITSNQIAQSIYDNNPVVIWGIIGNSLQSDSWTTESGKIIFAPRNAHVRLIYGVKGDPSNPVGFYLHDPLYGSIYWSKSQLEWNMTFANSYTSQGVVVK